MSGQGLIAAGIVVAAVIFLVRRLFFAERRGQRRPGPDVPLSALTRKHKPGCSRCRD